MVCLELATPVAKTCDAGGGARLGGSDQPGTDYWANLVRAGNLRMPPSATFALLPSCPADSADFTRTDRAGLRSNMIRSPWRRGRIRSAERVEAHLSVSSLSNLLSARLCGHRAFR